MRYSRQRDTVLKVVQSTDTHPTADWIYSQARKILPNISLGTVYRNLNQLVERGEIKSVKIDQSLRYDRNTQRHEHLKCTRCGQLYDVQILPDDLIQSVYQNHRFQVSEVDLTILGICDQHQPD